ncbi:AN1 zinc finger protein [Aspergillus ochraceoroseus]|uniref:AN1 zinc finger protein n=1 Tax=Aspergillus ochraceoroseus TaxID=138278 RepID=A0A0F8UWN1_9EURO|nr:AN1 zinc finger protein [Aspergillus ochraceoroseus]
MAPISINPGKKPSRPEESFTQMADKDLESIGRHCEFEYCNQLDFLPFRCESCRSTFCLDHRTETAHRCAQAGAWARRRTPAQLSSTTTSSSTSSTQKPTIYNSDQCAHLSCKPSSTPSPTRPEYCLKHRLREEHDCAPLAPLPGSAGAGAGATPNANETIRSMFARVRTWGKDKSHALTPKPKPDSPAARALQVNALKKSAKGDAAVPADKRLYVHVVGTSDTHGAQPPAGDFWFDSRWRVGRVLDDAAKRLRVENVNNRAGEEARLRLFHVESGEFLEFSDVIGAGKVEVHSGHTIVLLRGAGVMLGK